MTGRALCFSPILPPIGTPLTIPAAFHPFPPPVLATWYACFAASMCFLPNHTIFLSSGIVPSAPTSHLSRAFMSWPPLAEPQPSRLVHYRTLNTDSHDVSERGARVNGWATPGPTALFSLSSFSCLLHDYPNPPPAPPHALCHIRSNCTQYEKVKCVLAHTTQVTPPASAAPSFADPAATKHARSTRRTSGILIHEQHRH